ncbi:MAG: hypothetical protein ABIQ33_07185 [Caldimonas sp.]
MSSADAAMAWRALVVEASDPYQRAGRFAWHFARGKLHWDPVFGHLIARGLIAPRTRVLDIGCGQGLLASLVTAAAKAARQGRWPRDWAEAPVDVRFSGIELLARDVERAHHALGAGVDIVCADMRTAAFAAADTVVLLDVLHYVSVSEQDAVLARARGVDGRRPAGAARRRRRGAAALRGKPLGRSHRHARARPGLRTCRRTVPSSVACAPRRARLCGRERADAGRYAIRERPPRRHCRALRRPAGAAPMTPATLDHAGIEALIPHRGPMCLLDRMTMWDEARIECVAVNHRDPRHPLRSASGLLASAAIEYAAQAMAVHGALCAAHAGERAAPGLLASARDVRLACRRLDDLPRADRDELVVVAERQAADARRLLYAFVLCHDGRELATGRVAVVLDAALAHAR